MRPCRCTLAAALLGLALTAPAGLAAEPAYDQLPDERVLYIAPGQSLARLVERVYPDRAGEWDRIRQWIVDNNPHAFVDGDPDRLKAEVRVKLPSASQIAAQDRAGEYSLRDGAAATSVAPALAFDGRYVFVDPSQSLSDLVPDLYPEQQGSWERIIEAIIERNAGRLEGTDSGTVIERGTRLRIPQIRRPRAAPAEEEEEEDEAERPRPEPRPVVATVVTADGRLEAVDAAGRTRNLGKGDAVRRDDTLHTGRDARAKIRFDDGEQLFLRADSRARVRDWSLPETGPGTRVIELLRGGFRAITGAIGNRSEDMYRTVTAQTTLGVRGTAYAVRICGEDECVAGGGDTALAAGLYLGVEAGRVSLLNEAGDTAVEAGSLRYVAGPASAPAPAAGGAADVLFTQAERAAGIGQRPAGEAGADAEGDDDGGAGWGWVVLGIILLGAGL